MIPASHHDRNYAGMPGKSRSELREGAINSSVAELHSAGAATRARPATPSLQPFVKATDGKCAESVKSFTPSGRRTSAELLTGDPFRPLYASHKAESDKSRNTAFILSLLLGWLGTDRLYLGCTWLGFLKLFSLGASRFGGSSTLSCSRVGK
jgi:hypothetical protein